MAEGEISVTITNRVGLHARPARTLVQTAAQFRSRIQLMCKDKTANARSILNVLMLGAVQGDMLVMRAEGDDAEEALSTLAELVRRKFDEED